MASRPNVRKDFDARPEFDNPCIGCANFGQYRREWLLDSIRLWHRQKPFVNALRAQNHFVCIQLERYPALNNRHDDEMICQVLMPVFDGLSHCSLTWHEFQMIAGIIHKGSSPTEGHYQAVLFNSGCGLLCNDNQPPGRLIRDTAFY